MKYYAVLDTNVLVSAMLKPESVPSWIMMEALEGSIIPLLNQEIISEFREVLKRRKFKFDMAAVDMLIESIIERGIFLNAAVVEEEMPDSKDVVFYQIVMEGRKTSDAYLVTGNLKHFPERPFIVTPKEMMDIIMQKRHLNKD